MTDWSADFVGKNSSQFPSLGEALHRVISRRWKTNAAKMIERSWGVDPKTATNFASEKKLSERTLTKAAKAERWALWHALGEEMFGESYEDYLRGVINDLEQERQRAEARRDRLRDLEGRASRVFAVLDRPAA